MKKIILTILLILLSANIIYAGDIPEAVIQAKDGQLYFGKVQDQNENTVNIKIDKVLKGDLKENIQLPKDKTYFYYNEIIKDQEYIFAAIGDETYAWKVDSTDPKTVKVLDSGDDDMGNRLEKILNTGQYEKEKQIEKTEKKETQETPPIKEKSPLPISIGALIVVSGIILLLINRKNK